MNISFLGAGRWGITLGLLLNRKGHTVRMWENDVQRLQMLMSARVVPDLPENARIPDSLAISEELPAVLAGAEIIVLALPTQALRENLARLKSAIRDPSPRPAILVSVMKGIEISTKKRVSEIVRELLPSARIAVLTGPGMPYDVANGDPTSLLVAAPIEADAEIIRDNFANENLRVYSSNDLVGAELGGALKNVMAIAAGIADGMGLGINAKSALLTRGLYEVTRLGICLGANPMTFAGLSGVGDLIVTSFSPKSRNHQFGVAIAQGKPITEIVNSLTGVAEGYYTCQAAYELANRYKVELPITTELHRILYESTQPRDSIRRLFSRSLKSETWN